MKELIAQAAKVLIMEKGVKRLTVKDIVEECHITRQAFYYHFEDIPALFRWILQRDTSRTILEAQALGDWESRLHYLFVMAVNILPYMKKGMESNFRDELERFLDQYIQALFERVCDEEGLYRDCTRFESSLILRYHSQAILGVLRNWSESDTKNLDQIVHIVFRLMTEGIPPMRKN
ncbi:TetR/AcrR family transcriptional regulator [uncultured Flavonifractor sp.]|uniref:TetR/AcrR family transcriptional regulator n=1 Tax=uncultured Flavonifractor sp. TaxID=1193534 RepID=UPI00261FC003|nr:TetR/AcrR family transcriptional regulator [uncultured Flavonifractor sp.]